MEDKDEEVLLQKQVMEKKFQTFQNVELSLLKVCYKSGGI